MAMAVSPIMMSPESPMTAWGSFSFPSRAQHGHVEIRVRPDQGGVQDPAVQEPGLDGGAAGDDVGVGQDQSLGPVDDDPGAQAFLGLALGLAGKARAEKLAEKIVLEKRTHGVWAVPRSGPR